MLTYGATWNFRHNMVYCLLDLKAKILTSTSYTGLNLGLDRLTSRPKFWPQPWPSGLGSKPRFWHFVATKILAFRCNQYFCLSLRAKFRHHLGLEAILLALSSASGWGQYFSLSWGHDQNVEAKDKVTRPMPRPRPVFWLWLTVIIQVKFWPWLGIRPRGQGQYLHHYYTLAIIVWSECLQLARSITIS